MAEPPLPFSFSWFVYRVPLGTRSSTHAQIYKEETYYIVSKCCNVMTLSGHVGVTTQTEKYHRAAIVEKKLNTYYGLNLYIYSGRCIVDKD